MADPINAALVHPVYAGGDGGYLLRADTTFNVGWEVGSTCGYLHWTPGAIGPGGTDLVYGQGSATGVAIVAASLGTISTPGYSFLTTNSAGCRVVAACLQTSYVGPESTRAGRIHYGSTTGGLIDIADNPSVDGVGGSLPNWERTPLDIIQMNLRPGVGETIFEDPSSTTQTQTKDRCSALTLAWASLPAAVGLYVHLTVVYEWKPTVSRGLSSSNSSRASSANTMDDVLNYLQALGYEFVGRAGPAFGATLASSVMASLSGRMSSTALGSRQRLIGR